MGAPLLPPNVGHHRAREARKIAYLIESGNHHEPLIDNKRIVSVRQTHTIMSVRSLAVGSVISLPHYKGCELRIRFAVKFAPWKGSLWHLTRQSLEGRLGASFEHIRFGTRNTSIAENGRAARSEEELFAWGAGGRTAEKFFNGLDKILIGESAKGN
jgi:hypothetical protein